MRILILSLPFPPSIGGTESVTVNLATEFVRAGHEVCVVTETPGGNSDERFAFRVRRCLSSLSLFREVRWCDVFLHNTISLRNAWPLLFLRRPWVIAHHTWLSVSMKGSAKSRIKKLVARAASNICISSAIAGQLRCPVTVIGNPYDDTTFRMIPEIERRPDLLFVGTVCKLKGVDVLLRSLKLVKERHVCVHLTIVGRGPEETEMRMLARELDLCDDVTFAGPLGGEDLAREYNRHNILVVPSRWAEPYGIVALEGIACGCVPIGTAKGGLPEAIGPCGMIVPNEDEQALADKIVEALKGGDLSRYRAAAPKHLEKRAAKLVASAYLEVLQRARGMEGRFTTTC
jgi:glycosyltransferase involved in cell wall biosynthesis